MECKPISVLIFSVCFLAIGSFINADDLAESKNKQEEPVKEGNLSLPTSQQPSSFVGFGQNVIGEGVTQFYIYADHIKQHKSYRNDVIPGLLFGMTENSSLFLNLPFSPGNRQLNLHSSGLEDAFVQLEYAFYNKSTKYSTKEATVVGEVAFPTGSSQDVPPTGFGSPSLFLGFTYGYTGVDWLYFCAPGITFTTSYRKTRFGNQYYYQAGVGRNLWSPPGWIFAAIFEVDGVFIEKNRLNGTLDRNSGGNVIYATPSIWISNERLIFQLGVSVPIQQHLFGKQPENNYALDINLGWTF